MPLDSKSSTVIEGIQDDEPNKEILFFGRNLNQIPCFKESFLYGLLAGVGGGLMTFTATSRVSKATNTAVFTFTGFVLMYWFYCRHNLARNRFNVAQTQQAFEMLQKRGDINIVDNNDTNYQTKG
ncbi:cytochrome c oxidase assembly protein COX20, mitochondrial-like [Oppia nitens]|uniref:cytochrome c oxidase assembly protein COX20, mitochondrial-like n=1 Tax=Oppia nitens TaxID=1686743 RepID=UPI0023DCA318|nr:cytochrome c oxidase assembly protein COX20, mitochondrial-like [Oppia nitens]